MTDAQLINLLKSRFSVVKPGNGKWVRIKCPTCTPGDAMKLKRGVNLSSLASNCFICKQPLTIQQLFGREIIPASLISTTPAFTETKEHPQSREWPCNSIIPVNELPKDHAAVKFLAQDHLTDLDALYKLYHVGYVLPSEAKMITFDRKEGPGFAISSADSLVFPVFQSSELVGWQLRYVNPKSKKFKYLHVFPKGNYLYNYDNAKQYKTVVVVEGVKKSWKFPNAVATLGKGMTDKQIQLIQEWDQIIFLFDGEDDTQQKIQDLSDVIGRNKKCINIDPRNHGFSSPDEMTAEEAQYIVCYEWLQNGFEL